MTGTLAVLKSGLKLSANQALVQGCSFLRNVIIARLVSPEDFGIAATFAITYYLLDMASNIGVATHVIQAENGEDPRFQNTAQLLCFTRGLINGLIIFALAVPLSSLFGIPQAKWAFGVLAL